MCMEDQEGGGGERSELTLFWSLFLFGPLLLSGLALCWSPLSSWKGVCDKCKGSDFSARGVGSSTWSEGVYDDLGERGIWFGNICGICKGWPRRGVRNTPSPQ